MNLLAVLVGIVAVVIVDDDVVPWSFPYGRQQRDEQQHARV